MNVYDFPFPCDACGHGAAVHTEDGCTVSAPGGGLFPPRQCLCTRTHAEAANPMPRLRRLRMVS